MKKLLFFLMATLISTSFVQAFDIEEVAGFEEYEIDFGLKNFVAESYGPFELTLSLPIMDSVKLGIVTGLNLMMTDTVTNDYVGGPEGRIDSQNWTAINTDLDVYIGLPNIASILDLTILVGEVTKFGTYNVTRDTFTDATTETISGFAGGKVGAGIIVKSSVFGDVISDMTIRQNFRFAYGNGNSTDLATAKTLFAFLGITNTTNSTISNIKTYDKNEFFDFSYDGFVKIVKPFELGLPKFEFAAELDYSIDSISYTVIEKSVNDIKEESLYSALPSYIGGEFGVKANLTINPKENMENNFWVKPSFNMGSVNFTNTGRSSEARGQVGFAIKAGADWKTTFAKIVWLKFDAEYTFRYSANYVSNENIAFAKWISNGNLGTSVLLDPGITLGFNFDGWDAEFKWAPSMAYTKTTAADTNIWNLSNWSIGVSCKFPAGGTSTK